jgi:GntR family transcriptional regulator / MocR family aminotransferase
MLAAAFDRLRSEGYITAQPGTGTFVASELPDKSMATRSTARVIRVSEPTAHLSNRALQMIEGVRSLPATRSVGKAFRSHEPAIDLFPVNLWARVAGRVLRRAPRALYGQGGAAGYQPLRKAIAEYVGAARGVRCDAGQVIVTSGAQQALDLAARVLLDPGDHVCVEDPCYPGARLTLRAAGANLVAIPVDSNGLNIEIARKSTPDARMVYTTPGNQFRWE